MPKLWQTYAVQRSWKVLALLWMANHHFKQRVKMENLAKTKEELVSKLRAVKQEKTDKVKFIRRCSCLCKHFNRETCPMQFPVLTGEECFSESCFELSEEKVKPNLFELAQTILRKIPIVTDIRTYLMYRWNGKVWVDDAEGVIQRFLVEVEGENYVPNHLKTLTELIQALTFSNTFNEPPPNLICFENGVLDINSMELKPHTSDMFFRNMVHTDYNSTAKPLKFLSWLAEVLPDEEERKAVQEMFGYCLWRGYPFHYIFFLVGQGRNGRSTLMRTLVSILGRENCASIPLELLPERFQTTNLIGKMVNIVSEPKTTLVTTEILKMLTGEDLVTAEFKGKQKTIQFVNYAKIIVLANKLPPVNDSSLAWWRRVIVIEFPVTIPEEKVVPNIEQNWLLDREERSGIINWALEGLKRLLANGMFTKNEEMKNVVEEYRKWSSPALYFLEKYCIFQLDVWITKKMLYEAYKLVCEEEGLPIVSEEAFSREVKRQPRVRVEWKRVGGHMERVWTGIALNPNMTQVTQLTQVPPTLTKKLQDFKNFQEYKEPVSPVSVVSCSTSLTKENVELVLNGLIEASRVRGSATTEEVALESKLPVETVKAVLESLQRDGKVYSPYPDWWKVT